MAALFDYSLVYQHVTPCSHNREPHSALPVGECNVVIGRVQRRKADFNTTKPVSVLENGVGCMGLVVVSQGDRI